MMNISVIIPAYNSVACIERALRSIVHQTRPADEVIVVDDGSTDGTADIVRSLGDKVTLIQQANAGVSAARNTGIRAASGGWIAFLDADDEWLPDKLKLQCKQVQKNPQLKWVTGLFFNCRCQQDHQQTLNISPRQNEIIRDVLDNQGFFESFFQAFGLQANGNTNTMLIQKDALIEAGLFESGRQIAEDDDLWLRLAYHRLPLGCVPAPLAVYHLQTPDRATLRHSQPLHIETFLERHLKLSEEAGLADEFKACASAYLAFWIRKLLNQGRGSDARSLLRRYGSLLNTSYRLSTYCGSYCPSAWNCKEKIKRTLRSALKKDHHGSR